MKRRKGFHLVDLTTFAHRSGMAKTAISRDFLSETIEGVSCLGLRGYIVAAGAGLLNFVLELLDPVTGHGLTALSSAELAAQIVSTLAAIYLIATMIAEVSVSWKGGLRFSLVTAFCIGVPVGLLFLGLWAATPASGMPTAAFIILMLSLLAAVVALPLLSAWPIAQALSDRLVSPLEIMRATKGHRWGLIVAGYLTTALNKILPATETARSLGESIALAAGNSAVSCVSLLISASIAGTAWKFALNNARASVSSPARAN